MIALKVIWNDLRKKITTNELENIQENNKQDEVKYQENYFIGFDNFNLLDKSKILDSIINNVKTCFLACL